MKRLHSLLLCLVPFFALSLLACTPDLGDIASGIASDTGTSSQDGDSKEARGDREGKKGKCNKKGGDKEKKARGDKKGCDHKDCKRDGDKGERDGDKGERKPKRGKCKKHHGDRGERDGDKGERDGDKGERKPKRGKCKKHHHKRHDGDKGERDGDRGERDGDKGEKPAKKARKKRCRKGHRHMKDGEREQDPEDAYDKIRVFLPLRPKKVDVAPLFPLAHHATHLPPNRLLQHIPQKKFTFFCLNLRIRTKLCLYSWREYASKLLGQASQPRGYGPGQANWQMSNTYLAHQTAPFTIQTR